MKFGTGNDDLFNTIAEGNSISYVEKSSMDKLSGNVETIEKLKAVLIYTPYPFPLVCILMIFG